MSVHFKEVYDKLVSNKTNHEQGNFNCIPFLEYPKLEKFLPGVENSTYTILTASSGVGKSKLARSLYLQEPYNFVLKNPEFGIKLDILYFSLEERKEKVILSEIAKQIFLKTKQSISIKQLQSVGRFNTIPREIFPIIESCQEHIDNMLQVVQIIDNVRNPTGIYKYVRDFAMKIGTYYDKYGNPLNPQEVQDVIKGEGEAYKKVSYYRKHDPNHYVIVLTDHISLLDLETIEGAKMNQHQTMGRFSNYYCLKIRDTFGFTVVNVQQQASDKERIETNYKGQTIAEKLEPSLDGLGNNKETQRDADIVVGLFGPARYGLTDHMGNDIIRLRDNYRCLSILKDRDGESNRKLPLFFNGAIDYFKEMPDIEDVQAMDAVYAYAARLQEERRLRGE